MKDKYKKALANWTRLNEQLSSFNTDELETLLDFELSGENRKTFIKRIHQRIVKLKNAAERDDLLGE